MSRRLVIYREMPINKMPSLTLTLNIVTQYGRNPNVQVPAIHLISDFSVCTGSVGLFFHGDPASVYLCLCDPGIRQLQLMLLKVSLVLGVEIHVNVEFIKLLEPPVEQNDDGRGVCVCVSECVLDFLCVMSGRG